MVDLDSLARGILEDDFLPDLEVSTNLDSLNESCDEDTLEHHHLVVEDISTRDFLPLNGYALGLDISKNSTGVAIASPEGYELYNISLLGRVDEAHPHHETLLRRLFKEELLSLLGSLGVSTFETIIVEDAYSGENPKTVRTLYALNTAIDELILDGDLALTGDFVRADNKSWKSWLYSIYPGYGKSIKDKKRIQMILERLGVDEGGKGYQDRLDALGLVISYYAGVRLGSKSFEKVNLKLPKWSEIKVCGLLESELGDIDYEVVPLGSRLISRGIVREMALNRDVFVIAVGNRGFTYAEGELGINSSPYILVWRS